MAIIKIHKQYILYNYQKSSSRKGIVCNVLVTCLIYKRQADANSEIFSQLFIIFSPTTYRTLSQALTPCQLPNAACFPVNFLPSINTN